MLMLLEIAQEESVFPNAKKSSSVSGKFSASSRSGTCRVFVEVQFGK
jgi:hypothetical protein